MFRAREPGGDAGMSAWFGPWWDRAVRCRVRTSASLVQPDPGIGKARTGVGTSHLPRANTRPTIGAEQNPSTPSERPVRQGRLERREGHPRYWTEGAPFRCGLSAVDEADRAVPLLRSLVENDLELRLTLHTVQQSRGQLHIHSGAVLQQCGPLGDGVHHRRPGRG